MTRLLWFVLWCLSPSIAFKKILFLYTADQILSEGLTFSHHVAQLEIQAVFRNQVNVTQIVFPALVPLKSAVINASAVIVARNVDLLIGTSSTHHSILIELARKFPDKKFLAVGDIKTGSNLSTIFIRMYPARFIAGYLAGMYTKTSKLCYTAPHMIPEVYRGIHAFTLGAKAANWSNEVFVRWTGSIFDQRLERIAAETALDTEGCDVITTHQGSLKTAQVAHERGAHSIVHYRDGSYFSRSVLTSVVCNWTPLYVYFVRQLVDDAWIGSETLGMDFNSETPIVDLKWTTNGLVSTDISEDLNQKILELRQRFLLDRGNHSVFCGSAVNLSHGDCFDDDYLLGDKIHKFQSGMIDRGFVTIPEPLRVTVPIGRHILVMVAVPVGISVILVFAVFCFYCTHTKNRMIKAGSWPIELVILMSVIIGESSLLFYVVEPSTPICVLRWWMITIPITIILAALTTKTHRVRRIFNSRRFAKIGRLSNKIVFIELLTWMMPSFLTLLWYTIYDPPSVFFKVESRKYHGDPLDKEDGAYVLSEERVLFCTENPVYSSILLGYNLLLIIILGITGYSKTSHIPSAFNENKNVAAVVYNIILCSVLMIVFDQLLIAHAESPHVGSELGALIKVYGTLIAMDLTVVALCFHKIYCIVCGGDDSRYSFTRSLHTPRNSACVSGFPRSISNLSPTNSMRLRKKKSSGDVTPRISGVYPPVPLHQRKMSQNLPDMSLIEVCEETQSEYDEEQKEVHQKGTEKLQQIHHQLQYFKLEKQQQRELEQANKEPRFAKLKKQHQHQHEQSREGEHLSGEDTCVSSSVRSWSERSKDDDILKIHIDDSLYPIETQSQTKPQTPQTPQPQPQPQPQQTQTQTQVTQEPFQPQPQTQPTTQTQQQLGVVGIPYGVLKVHIYDI